MAASSVWAVSGWARACDANWLSSSAQLFHVVEIEQIRPDHGHEHGVGLIDRLAPCGRVNAGRRNFLERIDRRNDMRRTPGGSLTIGCAPSLEGQVQPAPGEKDHHDRDDDEPLAGMPTPCLCRDQTVGPAAARIGSKIVESKPTRRIMKPVMLAA